MSNIENFIDTRFFNDVVDKCGNIVFSHLVPRKRPIFIIFWIEVCVPSRISTAATVTQKYVKTGIGKNESQTLIGQIINPSVSRVKQTMLKKNDFFRTIC